MYKNKYVVSARPPCFNSCKIVPQEDTYKNDKSSTQNCCKGQQKGQICIGTISQIKLMQLGGHLHEKFHTFSINRQLVHYATLLLLIWIYIRT